MSIRLKKKMVNTGKTYFKISNLSNGKFTSILSKITTIKLTHAKIAYPTIKNPIA